MQSTPLHRTFSDIPSKTRSSPKTFSLPEILRLISIFLKSSLSLGLRFLFSNTFPLLFSISLTLPLFLYSCSISLIIRFLLSLVFFHLSLSLLNYTIPSSFEVLPSSRFSSSYFHNFIFITLQLLFSVFCCLSSADSVPFMRGCLNQ